MRSKLRDELPKECTISKECVITLDHVVIHLNEAIFQLEFLPVDIKQSLRDMQIAFNILKIMEEEAPEIV